MFFAGSKFLRKLERAQQLNISGDRTDTHLENVLEAALDLYLAKHDPKERHRRRELRKRGRESFAGYTEVPQPERLTSNIPAKDSRPLLRSRHIPMWMRDAVMHRDDYRCSYQSDTGTKCECRVGLQIDHIVPFALGGATEPENLRVLCRTHNLQAAVSHFGRELIDSKIAARQT